MEVINGIWYMQGVDWNDPSCIHSADELLDVILKVGFLSLFSNDVPGFSVENMTDADCWWTGDVDTDPWEWRAVLARTGKVAYGKFFRNKTGFIAKKWLDNVYKSTPKSTPIKSVAKRPREVVSRSLESLVYIGFVRFFAPAPGSFHSDVKTVSETRKRNKIRGLVVQRFHCRERGFASVPVSMQFHRSPYTFDSNWRELAKQNATPSNSIARCVKNEVRLVKHYTE